MPSANRATRVANVLSLLGAFVATAVVLGLLGAGLVLPAVGASGQAAKQSVALFEGLPGELEVNPLNQQSRILATDGSVIATPYDENRIVVPLSKIAPIMQKAQVAIEDKRFYEHGGVDPQGLARALVSNTVSGSTQGASTLTQQYVKVVLQDAALKRGDKEAAASAVSRSGTEGYLRKLQQLKYSVSLEQKMTKNQILEGYLNTVYMGDQQYGVEAAAQHYYGIPASKLNLQQAAMLAGVVQRPGATDPVNNPEAAKSRRNTVIQRMLEQKMVTPEEAASAKASPLGLNVTRSDQSCASSKYAYFCYYVQDWLMQQPSLGKTPKERLQRLRSGGLTIQTSLDPKKMAIIDKQIKAKVPVGNEADVQASAIMVQPGTGLVQAMGQNTTYSNVGGPGKTSVNYAAPSGAASAGFPVGSSIKMFAIVEALKQGRPIDSTVDVPRMTGQTKGGSPAAVFTNDLFNDDCGLGRTEKWTVGNEAQAPPGPMKLYDATGQSINTAFAELVGELGACNVRKTMTSMGLTQPDGDPIRPSPSNIVLGSDSSTPLDLANAYATVAAGGKYCEPRPVVSIKEANGKTLPISTAECKQVISPDVAAGTAQILTASLQHEKGSAKNAKLANGRAAIGKTGTVNNAIATWFVGSTPQLTTAVFVGRANDQKPLRDLRLGDKFYSGFIYGGTLAAPMWKSIMDQALKGVPKVAFDKPPSSMSNGEQVTVPSVVGMTAEEARAKLSDAGLVPSGPTTGTITGTSPGSGSQVAKGSTVRLQTGSSPVRDTTPAQPEPPRAAVVAAKPSPRPSPKPSASKSTSSPSPKPSTSSKPAPAPSTAPRPSPSATAEPEPGKGKGKDKPKPGKPRLSAGPEDFG
ncbi:membrane peptidoglycan carboxypeptidase [Barrientosiimonas humi]|uniref:Membrane peptidoglycan carboxypeptidase n=1 Tax=Barrientosiimonas humi TaxID=999931 RepID=A0A542WZR5_9MICO|nr:transglycosylase domain-containing protein [Barrientosiimonas humi]TQL29069.1 membrane peptidoglycan carboxypeptidase [Barrientosiimonas humi]CAG7571600.1 Penicillin-binding protein 1A [Barrientosiimonas humi]